MMGDLIQKMKSRVDFVRRVDTDLGMYTKEEDLVRHRHIYRNRKVVNLMVEVEKDSNFDFSWEHPVWVAPGYAVDVLDVKNKLVYVDTLDYVSRCLKESTVRACVLPMRRVPVREYNGAIRLLFSRFLERYKRVGKQMLFTQDKDEPMSLGNLLLSARESNGVVSVVADTAVRGNKHIETFETMADRVSKLKRSMAENLGFGACFMSASDAKGERTGLGNGTLLNSKHVRFANTLKFRHSFVHTGSAESNVNTFEKIRGLWY